MYHLEGVSNDGAVSKILSKYCPAGADKFAGNVFVSASSAPDFCKLVGFSSTKDTSGLEQIANVISDANYGKKAIKFEKQCNKMHDKLMHAKKSVTSTSHVGLGGLTSANSVNEILNKAEQQQKEIEENARVQKAQSKLDKYLDKNKSLHEAKQYTTAGKSAGGLISWGAGTESSEKNIFETIEDAKKPSKEFIDSAMARLKEFLGELLGVVSRVGIMPISDGNKSPNVRDKKSIKLNELTPADLMSAKNREIIYITR